jgi:amidohydrolase
MFRRLFRKNGGTQTMDMPELAATMCAWRRELHRMPELGYQEVRTADFLRRRLCDMGYQPVAGIGGTGLVARLPGAGTGPPVGFRADMDALPIQEETGVDWSSAHPGVMHACGHDGHMAMLLGAAAALRHRPPPPGDVWFIFQPAEETGAGARRMIEDGLFRTAPVEKVFGLHNWPDLPEGRFSACDGAQMAAVDYFDITVTGQGCHAAMPHTGRDALLAASQIHQTLQTIVSRSLDPLESGVVSVTQIHGGTAYNVVPDRVELRGCTRSLSTAAAERIRERMAAVCAGTATAFGLSVGLDYRRGYPVLRNSPAAVVQARAAARRALGRDALDPAPEPSMASEDFAFMLAERPGCYAFLGAGTAQRQTLHSPTYLFNDAILPMGAAWWIALTEGEAPPRL